MSHDVDAPAAFSGAGLVVAAGAEGVVLMPKKVRPLCTHLRMAIDLNAVPPLGVEGVERSLANVAGHNFEAAIGDAAGDAAAQAAEPDVTALHVFLPSF